jgi:PIN domain nuclease of toxin-antitoxin system
VTYLLDTSTLLWAITAPKKLSPRARRICESSAHGLVVSVVSVWEIVIKCGSGALDIDAPDRRVPNWIAQLGARMLAIEPAHAYAVHRLPPVHRDPFDRMLVAQALAEDVPLITSDERIHEYPARCIW